MGFPHLAKYAEHLLLNSLNEIVADSIKKAKEKELPLLKIFSGYSEEQLIQYVKNSISLFLKGLIEGKGLEEIDKSMKRWREDQIPGLRKTEVNVKDIVYSPFIRKYALLNHLDVYTSDINLFKTITLELEELFNYQLEKSIDEYSKIQEEIIRREEEFISLIINNIPDGISCFDTEYKSTVWNKALEERTGISKEKILGRSSFDFFPQYKDDLAETVFGKALKGEATKLSRVPYIHREGFYDLEVFPLKDENGKVIGGVSISRDITETINAYKQIEEKHRHLEALNEQLQKEKRFSSALLQSPVSGIIALDANLNYIEWNPLMEKYLDKKASEVLGRHVLEVFPGTQETDSVKAFREALKGKTTILTARQSIFKPEFYYDAYVMPIMDEDQNINGVISLLLDVGEKRKNEEKLKEREHFLNKITEITPGMIAIYDIHTGEYSFINQAITKLIGYEREQALKGGITFFVSIIHPDDLPKLVEENQKVIDEINKSEPGKESFTQRFEYRIRHKDGSWKWVETYGTVFSRNEENKIQSVLNITIDISERKKIEGELYTKNEIIDGILKHLPVIATKATKDGTIIESIGAGLDQLEMKQNEAVGLHIIESYPENVEYMTRVMKGEAANFISKFNSSLGTKYHQNYFFQSSNNEGIIGFSLDISAQKEAEIHLIESQRFIEKIAEIAPYPIAVMDVKKNKPVYVNYESLRILGFSEQEIKERHGKELIETSVHPLDINKLIERQQKIPFMKDDEISEAEYRLRDRYGNWIWLSSKVKVFKRDSEGNVEQYISVSANITDRKLYELDIAEKNHELASALEELKSAEEQLILANNDLEKRVDKRTRQLAASEEELKQTLSKFIELNEQVVRNEEQLRLLTDSVPALIAYIGSDYTYQFVNGQYFKWFVISSEDIVGKSAKEILGNSFAQIKPHMDKALSGERVKFENQINYKGKGLLTVETNYIPHLQDGKVMGFYSLVYDITEAKTIQQRLQIALVELEKLNSVNELLLEREKLAYEEAERQKNQLNTLFMQAPSLLAITRGSNFVFELANPKYMEVLGIEGSIIGKSVVEVMPELDAEVMSILHKVLETGERFVGNEIPNTIDWDRNGKPYTRYFTVIYEPVIELDGRADRIITFGYEVTEHVKSREKLKELNDELRDKNRELLRINNDLDNFIYTASHDLKAPISNMEGLIYSMEKSLMNRLEENEQKLFKMMETSIDRLRNTITSLTDISKISKNIEEKPEPVSISEIVADVKQDLTSAFPDVPLSFTEKLEVHSIKFVKPNLRSIIFNLLNNAIKYRSPERPVDILLRTFLNNGHIVISVADNGLGIKAEHREKLFMLFRRLHSHVEGTGVGLYIVKKIVENAGGRIEVESKVGKGSTFSIFIPEVHLKRS